jgi:NADPH:quinone reductase-like Zn-dependent oxidoreductase
MRAAVAISQNYENPLDGLSVQDMPEPETIAGWTRVRVVASSLNPHDVWTLRGVGHPADRIPMILGCDAAGVTEDGREVVIHPIIADASRGRGDETMDPQRAILSETVNGGLAEYVLVPDVNVIDKPAYFSFAEAAALPIAWGTAYRMLFTRAGLNRGDVVLVQGATGGVASACIALAHAAGARVYATARSESAFDFARSVGADEAFLTGARLPERVDIVVDSVGEATWSHSLKSLRPGGVVVTCGATSGPNANADLNRIFYQQLSVIGSTGCTRAEFVSLMAFMQEHDLRPAISKTVTLERVREGFEDLIAGAHLGKISVEISSAD